MGPGRLLDYLPPVRYTGFDPSESYVADATARYGSCGRFYCASIANPPVLEPGTFDLAIAQAVLHHLGDQEARDLFYLARNALRVGGRLITVDGCFVEGQNPVANFYSSVTADASFELPKVIH